MVTHRRTPSRSHRILPGWFFLLSGIVSIAAAVALTLLVVQAVGGSPTTDATSERTTAVPSATGTPDADPTESPTPTPSVSRSPSATPSPTATPAVDRSQYSVVVLNGTSTPGLASAASARVQQIGWPSAGVGNWRGPVSATTVYYPAGDEAAARLLASDLGVGSVAPVQAGMNPQRLTVVVLSSLG